MGMLFSKPIVIAALSWTTLISSLTASGRIRAQAPGQWVVPARFQVGRAAAAAAVGRPVDVVQMPDGSILISDDMGNRLLRVSYHR